jgi:hypothetical protein
MLPATMWYTFLSGMTPGVPAVVKRKWHANLLNPGVMSDKHVTVQHVLTLIRIIRWVMQDTMCSISAEDWTLQENKLDVWTRCLVVF